MNKKICTNCGGALTPFPGGLAFCQDEACQQRRAAKAETERVIKSQREFAAERQKAWELENARELDETVKAVTEPVEAPRAFPPRTCVNCSKVLSAFTSRRVGPALYACNDVLGCMRRQKAQCDEAETKRTKPRLEPDGTAARLSFSVPPSLADEFRRAAGTHGLSEFFVKIFREHQANVR